ncbi:zinc finger protein-like 1 isoform X2 [Centruroides sculpturatus]|uniref:zinc finger protein-like 1 isoform X1 n=1 Tax=Centruroides sculpturatus TaxID=218467 RepID=UPI000C6CBC9F|nr:zinc finger protein-like 1 isoform X1 [Centruroides sculpturatus]XP_023240438.1 zinc finger protein-like 1 isoform X2 [Centruroides sculpturatus]
MGLCKCSKKKVTNQFCFEHRVNVCEYCLVSDHPKCIVQSYLQWIQDSDYDPICQLCKQELSEGECVRLICYHVFHWNCLDNYACQLPAHTAPAGYTCPTCKTVLFPQKNLVSPVCDALKAKLQNVNWARPGLGLPVIDDNLTSKNSKSVTQKEMDVPSEQIAASLGDTSKSPKSEIPRSHIPTKPHSVVSMEGMNHNFQIDPYNNSSVFSAAHLSSPRKLYDSTGHDAFRPMPIDHDEDKYKRRSAMEWFSRWFKSRTILGGHSRRDPNLVYKRWFILVVLCFVGLCTLILIFVRLGRASADTDPLLDPLLNPNIRIEDKLDVAKVDKMDGQEGGAGGNGVLDSRG